VREAATADRPLSLGTASAKPPRLWPGASGARVYYYKARVYDPLTGRFLQTDPVGYSADLDLYTYVEDDPLDKEDPTGECPECVGALLGGALGGGVEVFKEMALEHRDANHLNVGAIVRETAIGAVAGATGVGAARLVTATVGVVRAAAVAGAVTSGVSSTLHGDKPGVIALKTAAGGVLGAVGGKVGAVVTSRLSASAPRVASTGMQVFPSKSQIAAARLTGVLAGSAVRGGGGATVNAACKAGHECK
jgi:RHS repeat-associated protein